jgi:CRP/FNR family transcriptional regulator, cyclic AMP receptor protein
MTTHSDVSVLAAHPFVRGMSCELVARLAYCCRHITLPADYRLFEDGGTADRFWLVDAGQVALDATVPGRGRVVIELLGRGAVVGLSWLQPPYKWQFGAVTTQPMQAYEFDGRAVRLACGEDPVLGYELLRRFSNAMARRLQVTRGRLIEAHARPVLAE